jgi:hypothetical protein
MFTLDAYGTSFGMAPHGVKDSVRIHRKTVTR